MSMGGYQHNDKPLFTAPFGKERIGPSIAVKKNKEHEIVLPVLPSAQSPSSTYEGPGEALCRALQGRMGLRLVALKEMKPELKPSKCNQKNPIHLNETWIGLLATGVSDTQLKTHWQSRAVVHSHNSLRWLWRTPAPDHTHSNGTGGHRTHLSININVFFL